MVFSPAVEKLEIVECDLERDVIGPAISNSSVVICCIGASEKEVFDVTGPYRIDYQATKKLVDAGNSNRNYHRFLRAFRSKSPFHNVLVMFIHRCLHAFRG